MKTKLLIASTLLALASQVNAASTNLVVNGSFESNILPEFKYSTFHTGEIEGWTTDKPGVELRNHVHGKALDGNNFAELDSTENSAIGQEIKTELGQAYKLSFAYSPRRYYEADTNGITVLWHGTELDADNLFLKTVTGSGVGVTKNVWTMFDYIVYGSGSDHLAFVADGVSDSLGGNIDNISLTAVSAVPVPSAAFLFAPALLGFIGLRRKSKNAVA